jgi:hypothetical protein
MSVGVMKDYKLTYEYRCDERLKTKNEESTRLVDTGFQGIQLIGDTLFVQ